MEKLLLGVFGPSKPTFAILEIELSLLLQNNVDFCSKSNEDGFLRIIINPLDFFELKKRQWEGMVRDYRYITYYL